MKKKISILLICLCVCIGGCGAKGSILGSQGEFVALTDYTADTVQVWQYRDSETGVCYLITSNGGMCPRYNADGTIYTQED